MIARIEHLDSHPNLQNLDLSANRIRVISGLKNLKKLRRLNLSGNKIVSLKGLQQLGINNQILTYFDISGNNINNLFELKILENFKNLKEVIFQSGSEFSNPLCRDRTKYLSMLLSLKNINSLKIDGKDRAAIEKEVILKKNRNEPNNRKKTVKRKKKPENYPTINQSEESGKKEMNDRFEIENQWDSIENESNEQKYLEIARSRLGQKPPSKEKLYEREIKFKEEERARMFDQISGNIAKENEKLKFKLETSEKYWVNKVRLIEENYRDIRNKLEFSQKEVDQSKSQIHILNEENKRVTKF